MNVLLDCNIEVADNFPIEKIGEFIESWKREFSYIISLSGGEIVYIDNIKVVNK